MGCSHSKLPTPYSAPSDEGRNIGLDAAVVTRLNTCSLPQLLDQDERPTFVLNMDDYAKENGHPIRPMFCNKALREQEQLLDRVLTAPPHDPDPQSGNAKHEDFQTWATVISRYGDSRDIYPLTLQYNNLLWTAFSIYPNWRIISAHEVFQTLDPATIDPPSTSAPVSEIRTTKSAYETEERSKVLASAAAIPTEEILPDVQQPKFPPVFLGKDRDNFPPKRASSVTLLTPDSCVPDWTAPHPKGVLSDHLRFVRQIDWASTPLGPMEKWSLQFREIVCLVMRNPHPSSHPALMGTGFSGPFGEMWHKVGPIIRACARTGHSMLTHNQPLPIMRYGYMEESFFTWSFVPVFGGTERILGFYLNAFDTTVESISSRRMGLLRYLGECLNATRTVKEFWGRVLEGLIHNDYDVPLALLYSVSDSEDADNSSCHSSNSIPISTRSCILEGSVGVPRGHAISPEEFSLNKTDDPLILAFIEAMQTVEPKMLEMKNGTLPESLLEGIEWRGYGDPCREAIILPLRPTNADNVCALLLLGINPRRAYDQEYRSFTAMLNRQIATSLASVLLFEDEMRRTRHAAQVAALQQESLSLQLQLQTNRMRRMTEFSPLGMFLVDPNGRVVEANERYFEMTGHPRDLDKTEPFSWLELCQDRSKEVVMDMWYSMVETRSPTSREVQLNCSDVHPRDFNGEPIDYWALVSGQAEITPEGELLSFMGSLADISHLKWAQGLQERRLREAEESKRQQNEFIDITSHEMRNPLSAILICADDIRDTLTHHTFIGDDDSVAKECIEAANNIALCVQHQKAIVDDILTVSKLNSHLLHITPVPAQPLIIVQRSMAMFRPEVQAKGIKIEFVTHDTLQHLGIDWVMLDPSRLLQILVNLITNAIKFTQNSPKRIITVQVCASADNPDFNLPTGFQFIPPRNTPVNFANGEGWGSGQLIYLGIEVQDTGVGLSSEEKALLFEKFAQASPRTHVEYGGSSLGLFISRQLVELHGGQIGVTSEAGVGSTFGFYLQCRRMLPKSHNQHHNSPEQSMVAKQAIISRNTASIVAESKEKPSKPGVPPPTMRDKEENAKECMNTSTDERNKDSLLHVLVVEDNMVNQKVLTKQLIKEGCIVSTADNGVYALQHLEKTRFRATDGIPLTIILMDCEMPEMDGLTCCRKIREMEQRREVTDHVPIIAVTANIRGGQIETAKESGMDEVIGKPFRIPDLLAKMRALLKRLEEKKEED
ncbi:hypothetical protein BDW02DRAFT_638833 [Decorospora gaudefroyi]|uniref:Aerobic respiration control sensor protein arcB n=1 Tax=Decorospora gaudefroyi TaxID=184978 RepID=A0A6A5KGQ6_9PLEO|nr:hypothetical protein BDW02DRAFT_638833 [Decorospora gaudefroyi]